MLPLVVSQEVVTEKAVLKTTLSSAQHIFFPNLNGLRFLAALLVLASHIEGGRLANGQTSFLPQPGQTGQMGVTLFFVLSGFLITYLLLAEKERFGSINFKAFFLRRILRIWPLYYAVVILGLFILPHINFFYDSTYTPLMHVHLATKTVLFVLILPNVIKELYPVIPFLTQSWSIGVEEQFYIIWPILVHYSRDYFRNFLLLAGVVYLLSQLSWALTTPQRHVLPINELTDFVKHFLFFFRIQCMAIGGLFALVLFQDWKRTLKILTSRLVQVGIWVVTLTMVLRGQAVPYVHHELYSIMFGIIILNLALTNNSLVNLQYKTLDYLGRISYGVYMLHIMAIVIGSLIAKQIVAGDGLANHLVTILTVIATTIALAAFSYHCLEMPFLKLKKRFVRIQSGS